MLWRRNLDSIFVLGDGDDFDAEQQIGSLRRYDLGNGQGDHSVIDDPRRRDQQSANASDVGFKAHKPGAIDRQDLDVVLLGALEQSLHADALALIGGDEKLAAIFEFDALFRAESHCRGSAFAAKASLQASRRVIDARMDNAAVVPGLVPGDGVFFFEENDRRARPRAQNFAGRR